jgi:hypothetical protein
MNLMKRLVLLCMLLVNCPVVGASNEIVCVGRLPGPNNCYKREIGCYREYSASSEVGRTTPSAEAPGNAAPAKAGGDAN